ncbi:ABC transporter ATP-binding protein [Ramlibacter sp. AN1015]|uniref:ABC transporter ATP-binding protein n=1 Tax=Ramlibacter sp. AN1015 TaxID=3133428 RepID=UPI0030C51475
MSALLSVAGVGHHFRGLTVLKDVSFEVPPRSITGLIGPNGAGKSTLFNIVSGFLRPSAGTIRYEDRDVTGWDVTRRSHQGLVRTFQTPQVFKNLTVEENLVAAGWSATRGGFVQSLLHLPGARRARARMQELARQTAASFGLEPVWAQRAGDLPAGRQRLVELARAALLSPRLLCLDEPSSGLNQEEVAALRLLLERLNRDGVTILLVSHDMELMEVASSVHVLCFGEIIAAGDFRTVKQDPRVREAYLGV